MTLTRKRKTFFGWQVVGAAFVLAAFGWGVGFYGPPVFLHAVREARGWSLSLVSTAVTVHYLVGALVVANLPRIYRRFGIAAITKASVISLALGVAGWAMAAEPWQLLVATCFSGAGWVAMAAAGVNAIVSQWFVRSRPAALAMAYNGASAGGIVFSPLWVALIAGLGFPMATAVVGLVMVLAVWVLADVYFARTPQSMGLEVDGDQPGRVATRVTADWVRPLPGPALWRNRQFLTLAAAMALGLFAQIGLLAHLFSLLVPAIGTANAGFALGAATGVAIVGRTLVGVLMPADADRRLFAIVSYGVQVAGSLILLLAGGGDVVLLLAGVLLFGAGIGNATSLPPLIAQREFMAGEVARVVALIVSMAQAGYAFAPAAFGLIREFAPALGGGTGGASGAAGWVFVAAACLQGGAMGAMLLGRRGGGAR